MVFSGYTPSSRIARSLLLFSLSVVCDSFNPVDCSTPDIPVLHHLQRLLKLMSIESVMPSSHLILCCPLLLLPPIRPSIKVFSNESTLRIGVSDNHKNCIFVLCSSILFLCSLLFFYPSFSFFLFLFTWIHSNYFKIF